MLCDVCLGIVVRITFGKEDLGAYSEAQWATVNYLPHRRPGPLDVIDASARAHEIHRLTVG